MLCTPLAFQILSGSVAGGNREGLRSFKARFGCSPDVCSVLWEMMSIRRTKPRNMTPKHLLWALLFMKTYNSETMLSGLLDVERKTFRKWIWLVIRQIQRLKRKVVSVILVCVSNFVCFRHCNMF